MNEKGLVTNVLYLVESGALTAQADGAITLTRSAAYAAEAVAPGTEIVLQAGDQVDPPVVVVPGGGDDDLAARDTVEAERDGPLAGIGMGR